ncbi:MAG: hypothetical protein HONDAALG_03772 [Gammaproteobacteria bacterium]|nr:hypothetical protein [Gammaproteobacteria bacterium]
MKTATVTATPKGLLVRTPYDPAFVAGLKASIPAAGRMWDATSKVWIVAHNYSQPLGALLSLHYPGVQMPAVAGALRFVKPFDVDGTRFLVVSDGEPDSAIDALAEAAKFAGRIDTIYVGPESGEGREFLARLARGAGGRSATATAGLHLAAAATLLLGSGT